DKEQELDSIRLLKTKQVEGIVMLSWILDEDHVNFMKESRIPAVYISKTARDYDIYTVSTSNEKATYDMTKYLIESNHKDIALIMTSKEDTILEMERRRGYEAALKDNNISVRDELIKYGNTDYEGGY
ncbi:LacI family transcriptional regulator, partial [Clostridium perfringens]|nr:LacI family transcriptional regulator [Clostridium perfringens]